MNVDLHSLTELRKLQERFPELGRKLVGNHGLFLVLRFKGLLVSQPRLARGLALPRFLLVEKVAIDIVPIDVEAQEHNVVADR